MISKEQSGFTLVELLVALAIFSIITAMAAPSFSSMVERNKLVAEANRLLGNFRLARNEAVKRNAVITVAGIGTNWQSGFNVYANHNNDVSYDNSNDQIIRKESKLSENLDIASVANEISFASNGALEGVNSITMYLCKTRGAKRAMEITINRIGRAEAKEITDTSNCSGS